MRVAIRQIGHEQVVLIPKPILARLGLTGAADLQVRDGVIEIRPLRHHPREGWANDARRLIWWAVVPLAMQTVRKKMSPF